jgi:hypothetical protein
MTKKFYAQKDALGFPILGTMMSAANVPNQNNIIEISSSTGLPAHPEGFKYYVHKDEKGNILANSLFASYEKQDSALTLDLHDSNGNCIQFVADTTLGGLSFGMTVESSSNITYSAAWGDGTTSTGTINTGMNVDIEHLYADADTAHNVTLCFSDATKVTYISIWGTD